MVYIRFATIWLQIEIKAERGWQSSFKSSTKYLKPSLPVLTAFFLKEIQNAHCFEYNRSSRFLLAYLNYSATAIIIISDGIPGNYLYCNFYRLFI